MKGYKCPEFVKLGTGGDPYIWRNQLKTHFESKGTWSFVSQNEEIELEEDSELTEERVIALCRRDILASLHPDVKSIVMSIEDPHVMYTRIIRLFLGSETAQRRKLRAKLNEIEYGGRYFFLTRFENFVSQLIQVEAIHSYKKLASQFLNKLPRSMSTITYPYKERIEQDYLEDNQEFWEGIYNGILDYLIESGYYDATKRQYQSKVGKSESYKAKRKEKFNQREKKETRICHKCKKKGHLIRDCPLWKEKNEKEKEIKENSESWMCTTSQDIPFEEKSNSFLLDSGASDHICGATTLFTSKRKILDKHIVVTANGEIQATHKGTINLTLDNNLRVEMKNVLYWKNAPNLISVPTLASNGIQTLFKEDQALLLKNGINTKYTALKRGLNTYTVKFIKESTVFKAVSKKVWHARLNHCSESRLEKTVPKSICPDIEKPLLNNICKGCVFGKMHRADIKRKTPTKREPLELIAADCMGPFDFSVNGKRYSLTIVDTGAKFIWSHPFRTRTQVPLLIIEFLKKIERQFPKKIIFFDQIMVLNSKMILFIDIVYQLVLNKNFLSHMSMNLTVE